MALNGLTFHTWLGWLCGILLLNHPWGSPSFTSWLSFSTLYALFGMGMYFVLMIDFISNTSEGLFQGNDHQFGKWVRAFAIINAVVTTQMKKLSFAINAKKLGKLMEILSDYQSRRKPETRRNLCGRWNLTWESIIIHLSFLVAFITTLLRGVEFVSDSSTNPHSWFSVLGVWGYSFIYYSFAILPLLAVTNCAFAIILVTSHQVASIFCDFCDDVKQAIPRLTSDMMDEGKQPNMEIFSILQMSNKFSSSKSQVTPLAALPADIIAKSAQLSRLDIIDQFEEIKDLMKLTNEALSPLLLWSITGITLGLVATASQMFVSERAISTDFIAEVLYLFIVLLYGLLLQGGHKIGEMQKKSQLLIQREFLNMPWTPGKLEIEDLVQELLEWEWKLSACGFFTLNRRLASGIFSLVLNYVVIFVQLNIALTEPPLDSCIKNNGTAIRK